MTINIGYNQVNVLLGKAPKFVCRCEALQTITVFFCLLLTLYNSTHQRFDHTHFLHHSRYEEPDGFSESKLLSCMKQKYSLRVMILNLKFVISTIDGSSKVRVQSIHDSLLIWFSNVQFRQLKISR